MLEDEDHSPMLEGGHHDPHAGRQEPQFSSMLESVVVEGEVTGHVVSEVRKQGKMMLAQLAFPPHYST